MPTPALLTWDHINLLFEIYNTPMPSVEEVVMTPGTGVTISPSYINSATPVQLRLIQAVDSINRNESQVRRVVEILEAYNDFALDPSPIDREGYKFSANRNITALRNLLYSYTGVLFADGGNNVMRLG